MDVLNSLDESFHESQVAAPLERSIPIFAVAQGRAGQLLSRCAGVADRQRSWVGGSIASIMKKFISRPLGVALGFTGFLRVACAFSLVLAQGELQWVWSFPAPTAFDW
jgi:hypothetical protein